MVLFALPAGAVVDRVDRRQLLWRVDAVRCAIHRVRAAAVITGWVSIPVLMVLGFLLGIGQTLYDTASQAFVPALVSGTRIGWNALTAA